MAARPRVVVAVAVAIVGVVFATACRCRELVGEWPFVALVTVGPFLALVLLGWDRIVEINLRSLSMRLDAARQEVQEQAAELRHLKFMFKMDGPKMEALGLKPGAIATAGAIMRYCAGSIKRERERVARAVSRSRNLEEAARAIVSEEDDDHVFKWNGPETSLDTPPKSVEERQRQMEDGS